MCFTTAKKAEPCYVEANLLLCFETLRRFSWSHHTIVAGPKVTEDSAENIVILSYHEIKVTCTTVQFSQVLSSNGTVFLLRVTLNVKLSSSIFLVHTSKNNFVVNFQQKPGSLHQEEV